MSPRLREALNAVDRSPALQNAAGSPMWLSLVVISFAQEWGLDPSDRRTLMAFARQIDGGAAA